MAATANDTSEKGSRPSEVARIPVETLFRGRAEIVLVHNGEDYRLRITSRGKLILTK